MLQGNGMKHAVLASIATSFRRYACLIYRGPGPISDVAYQNAVQPHPVSMTHTTTSTPSRSTDLRNSQASGAWTSSRFHILPS